MAIGIIAILAALLLPALHRAKMKAQQAACLSNQRQIGLDFHVALDDASGRLDTTMLLIGDRGLEGADDWIEREVRAGRKDWLCPSTRPSGDWLGSVQSPWSTYGLSWQIAFGSYGVNGWLGGGGNGLGASGSARPTPGYTPQYLFRAESYIAQPVLTPLLADGVYIVAWPYALDLPARNLSSLWEELDGYDEMKRFAIPRHGSRPTPVPTNWPRNQPLPGAISHLEGEMELAPPGRPGRFLFLARSLLGD